MSERGEAPAGTGASNSGDRAVDNEGMALDLPEVGSVATLGSDDPALDLPGFYGDVDGSVLAFLTEAVVRHRITDWNPASIGEVAERLARIPLVWLLEHLTQIGVSEALVRIYLTHMVRRRPRRIEWTDVACGRRLVAQHGRDLRHVAGRGWFVWDGVRWASDDSGEVMRRAKAVADVLQADGNLVSSLRRGLQDEGEREDFLDMAEDHWRAASTSQSAQKLKNTILLAESEPGIPVRSDDLDSDAHLLNVLNGTIDLRTGTLRPHCRDDLITRLAPVHYDPEATSAAWERYLETTTAGDADLAAYLQRVAGYSLLGENPEEVLFFVYGPGATGKSTFIEALRSTLGDYAAIADFEAFIKKPSGGISNDIARLAGVRFVASIEVDQGKELAQGLVKTITGGDTVAARFLYKEPFEFTPRFTLFLVANHAPGIDASDEAMWRRMRVIPFENVVPADQRDPALKAKVRDPSRAGAAILAWAVRGLHQYREIGLATPAVVAAAGEDYRAGADPVGVFLDDECELGTEHWTSSKDLFGAYAEWARANGVLPILTSKALAPHLQRHECESTKRHGGTRGWQGVRLRSEAPYPPHHPPLTEAQVKGEIGAGGAHRADLSGTSSEEEVGW